MSVLSWGWRVKLVANPSCPCETPEQWILGLFQADYWVDGSDRNRALIASHLAKCYAMRPRCGGGCPDYEITSEHILYVTSQIDINPAHPERTRA